MPPSAVFSYWRRDHRRTSPAPGSVSPVGNAVGGAYSPTLNIPPRLPGLPASTTLGETYIDGQDLPEYEQRPQSVVYLGTGGDKRLSTALSSQHSYTNLRVPSTTSTDNVVRPHSSPGNTANNEESMLSVEPIQSPPSNAHGNQPDMQSQQKSNNGSWRLGFNRNQAEDHRPSKTVGKDLRINTNVDGELGFIGGVTLKELRSDIFYHEQQQQLQPQQEHSSQQKHGKTKRHLLNPMTLLARRRSSQFTGSRVDEGSLRGRNLVPAIPDDYDPRIRGNIVHDFSAPRPRPQIAGRDCSGESVKKSSLPSSAVTRHSEHSPVFKEHFEEDGKVLQIENKGFLQSSLLTNADHDIAELPEFARRLPSSLPEHDHQHQAAVEVEDEENENQDTSISVTPQPPASIQPTPRSSPRKSVEVAPNRASSIPIRLKSDASRFSFDMNGVGSSVQEKLLEEKHKKKEAARREKAQQERSSFSDYGDDDDFDYDAMEDDGGFEERIPGINADAEDEYDDEFQNFSGVVRISESSTFIPMLPTIVASPIMPAYSAAGMLAAATAIATAGGTPPANVSDASVDMTAPLALEASLEEDDGFAQSENDIDEIAANALNLTTTLSGQPLPLIEEDEDDMYYDDGDFGDLPENEENDKFDESIFDEESGQLYERKFYPGTKIPVALQEGDEQRSKESQIRNVPSLASEVRPESWDFRNCLPPSKPTGGSEASKAPGGVLSEHNLEAFHSALARVADEAAAGNLQRNASLSENSLGQGSNSQLAESHPGLISDDTQYSGFDDELLDDFNYDDDDGFDDDLIIAEANADALENDDEGFYGQEFGFYARSNNENCTDEPIYGGYFGPSGAGGLNRSRSGGAGFREPSLTPITERSEWSTRNSIISLTTHGPSAVPQQPPPNPGLSQLVDMEYNEDDMSLGALMKLRRGAFGGSNGSLRSTGSLSPQPGPVGHSNRASFLSIPEDSPVDLTPDMGFQQQGYEHSGSLNGVYYYSSNMNQMPLSEGQSLPASPTLTLDRLTGGERRSSVGSTT
ncbi:hypothetical protein TMatcc_000303 [Talaromyces marneffei ATCC 18224]|uniref:Uncharacterized protein n=1 Tax=Talaromyces marneffei (strain ATCC 18224 / CBS 334.59 / QM 7333) TaxID=441960 RepID=B6QQB8_TALMQ|nr:uncharacterized protein EYB26_005384 [Talaromyces marneffei]EEA20319.1 conserved hypothetical protein [Talaromyces marneffei ATCC 18224]KAE8549311.1 hypothetical protein EYB25_007831 [Talaromyces marneffei]QGA17709.1 hypothetical protein EYB26_005384 [Talaromyces marneffei]